MKKIIILVLSGFLVAVNGWAQEQPQLQRGFTIKDLHEWARGEKTVTTNNQLKTGESLRTGERLQSANGEYYLLVQTDGNLVIYNKNNRHIWDAKCGGTGNGSRLDMQSDGNLVVYDRNGKATWSSQTHPYFNPIFRSQSKRPVKVVLENSGELILYNAAGLAMWTSARNIISDTPARSQLSTGETLKTGEQLGSADGNYYALLQADGNLVIYDRNDRPVWDAQIGGGNNGSRLDMQSDGNLVVYDTNGKATWSSQTHPYFDAKFRSATMRPVKLVLENDGKLKLYNRIGRVVWSSQ